VTVSSLAMAIANGVDHVKNIGIEFQNDLGIYLYVVCMYCMFMGANDDTMKQ